MALLESSNIGKKVAAALPLVALPLPAVNVTTEAKLQETRKRRSHQRFEKIIYFLIVLHKIYILK